MGNYLSEIGSFLWAVINNWAGYCTGGVIVALLWLWSTLKQQTVPRRVGIAVAVFFLLLAIFNAWRDQHHQVIDLTNRLLDSTPGLSGVINYVYAAPFQDGSQTSIFISATITNSRYRSAARGWRLNYYSKSLTEDSILYQLIPAQIQIPDLDSGKKFTIGSEDSLAELALKPIGKGDVVSGWLLFAVPGNRKDEILNGDPTLTVTFMDYRADPSQKVAMQITPRSMPPPYVPGLTYPIR